MNLPKIALHVVFVRKIVFRETTLLQCNTAVGGARFERKVQSRIQGGAWGSGSPPSCPQDFFKIMQFAGNFKGKTPILSQVWAQVPPLGVKTLLAPLTKILDPRPK